MAIVGRQTELTLEIKPHPDLAAREQRGEPTWITGTLKLGGELRVYRNFDAGELLRVQLADTDGEVIATGTLEVKHVVPKPIEDKDMGIIGMERHHVLKVVETAPTDDEATA